MCHTLMCVATDDEGPGPPRGTEYGTGMTPLRQVCSSISRQSGSSQPCLAPSHKKLKESDTQICVILSQRRNGIVCSLWSLWTAPKEKRSPCTIRAVAWPPQCCRNGTVYETWKTSASLDCELCPLDRTILCTLVRPRWNYDIRCCEKKKTGARE
ncbi:hypothetical protein BC826DRAFT_137206 [Russula brevipes]|nr:hypothetical protein BC826DRAFT_137206 [Russula brevipes]